MLYPRSSIGDRPFGLSFVRPLGRLRKLKLSTQMNVDALQTCGNFDVLCARCTQTLQHITCCIPVVDIRSDIDSSEAVTNRS